MITSIQSYISQVQAYADAFIRFLMALNQTEIIVLVIILGLLILYLAYRYLGLGGVLALSIIYAVAYVIYTGGVSNFYKKSQEAENSRSKELWEAIRLNESGTTTQHEIQTK